MVWQNNEGLEKAYRKDKKEMLKLVKQLQLNQKQAYFRMKQVLARTYHPTITQWCMILNWKC